MKTVFLFVLRTSSSLWNKLTLFSMENVNLKTIFIILLMLEHFPKLDFFALHSVVRYRERMMWVLKYILQISISGIVYLESF